MTEPDPNAPTLGTMLGVWAHPDDETYLAAGLMAVGVRQGNRVVCVTATRGEEGSWDEGRWPLRPPRGTSTGSTRCFWGTSGTGCRCAGPAGARAG